MVDYSINHTPERTTIEATGETEHFEEGEAVGSSIEGSTTFTFKPKNVEYIKQDYINLIEDILEKYNFFTHGEDPFDPYYHVVSERIDWSHYHLAVEGDKYIALFVQPNTTEESVKHFHEILEEETAEPWTVEKHETDLNGSGANR